MAGKQIEKLEETIAEYLQNGSKIVEINITNLTAPGENYGSEIYKVDLKIENKNGKIEDLNVVAKQIPLIEYYQEVFNVQVTFNAEKEFYKTVVPAIQEFQNKHGLQPTEVFPKFFGGRNNLNGVNNVVDKDALIVLENLKIKGYINLNRYAGFDLSTSKLILKSLAQFHATSIAMKLKEPETFEQKLKRNCACFLPPPPPTPIAIENETKTLVKLIENTKVSKSIGDFLRKSLGHMVKPVGKFREPFATLVHTDFWVNNIMVKVDKETSLDVKFVDFKMYSYDSPVRDLLFFLFTSVNTEVLKQNFDALIKYYHGVFVDTLLAFNCDVTPFSYVQYMEEFPATMVTSLGFMMFMLVFIIRGKKGGVINKDESTNVPTYSIDHMTTEDKDRIHWLIEEFHRRKWL